MPKSKPRPISEDQANILIAELGVMALSPLLVMVGTISGWFKVKRKAEDLIGQIT
jgi:hypothetical protein